MSLLGIDLGTTVCKAAAFSIAGECLATAAQEYEALATDAGQAELDSHDIWHKTRDIIRTVAAATKQDPITALCVSAMGETFVPVTRKREILSTAILCSDTRGTEHAEALEEALGQEDFYRINPNILGPQYSLPKLLWLRDHESVVYDKADLFLLMSDFIGFMLGCEPTCNNSHANRTLLFDLEANDWSETLLAWSGVDRNRLGRVVPGGTVVGTVSDTMAAELGLPSGVQVVAGGHDQCLNALGCGCIEAGRAVCGIGTYECLEPIFTKVRDPLKMLAAGMNIEHHVLPDLYVAFLYNQAGALVKWFRNTFAPSEHDMPNLYAALNAEMPEDPTSLLVLPHFDPPQWPRFIGDTAGAILGLRTTTTRGEILKAIMESTTLYFVEALASLRSLGIDTTEFVASGGGARSDAWLQIHADIFGVPIVRLQTSEGGLAGAAMLAGLGTGTYATAAEATEAFVRRGRVFEPQAERHSLYQEKHALFRTLYSSNQKILQGLRAIT